MTMQYQDKELLTCIILTIKELRKSRGITLETFYFDTGIHLARIEQGKTNISVSTLAKICNYFDISLVEFFEKVETINNKTQINLSNNN
jgi:transcriptional regulator with XRE-family HTH domain